MEAWVAYRRGCVLDLQGWLLVRLQRRGGSERFVDAEDRRRSNVTLLFAVPVFSMICFIAFLIEKDKANSWPLPLAGAVSLAIATARHWWLKRNNYATGPNAFQYYFVALGNEYRRGDRRIRGRHEKARPDRRTAGRRSGGQGRC